MEGQMGKNGAERKRERISTNIKLEQKFCSIFEVKMLNKIKVLPFILFSHATRSNFISFFQIKRIDIYTSNFCNLISFNIFIHNILWNLSFLFISSQENIRNILFCVFNKGVNENTIHLWSQYIILQKVVFPFQKLGILA